MTQRSVSRIRRTFNNRHPSSQFFLLVGATVASLEVGEGGNDGGVGRLDGFEELLELIALDRAEGDGGGDEKGHQRVGDLAGVLLRQRVLNGVVDRYVLHRHMLHLLDLLRQRDNLLLLLLLLLLQRRNAHVGEVVLLLLMVLLVLLLKLLLDLNLVLLLLLELLVLHLLKLVLVDMHLLLLNLLLLLLLLLKLLLLLLLLNDQAVIRRSSFASFLDGLSVGSIAVLVAKHSKYQMKHVRLLNSLKK